MGNKCFEQELLFGRDSQSTLKRKALTKLMTEAGIDKQQIAEVIGVSIRQVYNYEYQYQSNKAEYYADKRYKPCGELFEYKDGIIDELTKKPPATSKEAAAKIYDLTGIKRSPTQVRQFMHSVGMRPLRTAQIPAKADPEAQKEFLEKELIPRIEKAKAGKQVLLFMDATHFIWQVYLGILWCLSRIFIPAASGRQRINVLGALDPITMELTKIINRSYITATTVCQLLRMLAEKYSKQHITIVLDNARYQRCKLVMETAAELKIELLFLPTYSPNLNLIERLWRYVKKECLYSKYYQTAGEFETAINSALSDISTTKKRYELRKLITFKFQVFKRNDKAA